MDLKEILDTGLFNLDKAQMNVGWMMSLREEINPETIEYGISSFVYRARKPFHPKRLFDLVSDKFFLVETGMEEMEDDAGEEQASGEESDAEETFTDEKNRLLTPEETKLRRSCKNASAFRGVLRSKGFLWIATRPINMGDWSTAGMSCI